MIRKLALLAGLSGTLFVAGCGGSASSQVTASLGARDLPTISPPAYVPGPLDGYSTPRSRAIRRPLSVIIENYSPDSRPQSGLGGASTVVETLAEGGVTRFMAIYLENDSAKVGPVRSTRMYFDQLASGFHTILAHVGGNDDAQAALFHLPKVFNIDENKWEISLTQTGTPLFWRSANRVAPHNMYTSTYMLRAYAAKNGQNWAYTGTSLLHKSPPPLQQRGKAQTISISFENPLAPAFVPDYAVRYVYDRKSNTYLRFMGGSAHVDADTNRQLRPANVIVMQTRDAVADPNAGPTPESILIPVIGSGPAVFFRDGKAQRGIWKQPNQFAPLQFYDRQGHQAAFDPGQTWIEVVPSSSPWSFR